MHGRASNAAPTMPCLKFSAFGNFSALDTICTGAALKFNSGWHIDPHPPWPPPPPPAPRARPHKARARTQLAVSGKTCGTTFRTRWPVWTVFSLASDSKFLPLVQTPLMGDHGTSRVRSLILLIRCACDQFLACVASEQRWAELHEYRTWRWHIHCRHDQRHCLLRQILWKRDLGARVMIMTSAACVVVVVWICPDPFVLVSRSVPVYNGRVCL